MVVPAGTPSPFPPGETTASFLEVPWTPCPGLPDASSPSRGPSAARSPRRPGRQDTHRARSPHAHLSLSGTTKQQTEDNANASMLSQPRKNPETSALGPSSPPTAAAPGYRLKALVLQGQRPPTGTASGHPRAWVLGRHGLDPVLSVFSFFSKQLPNRQRLFPPESEARIPSFPGGPCQRNRLFQNQQSVPVFRKTSQEC